MARMCSNGHILDDAWTECPYCQGADALACAFCHQSSIKISNDKDSYPMWSCGCGSLGISSAVAFDHDKLEDGVRSLFFPNISADAIPERNGWDILIYTAANGEESRWIRKMVINDFPPRPRVWYCKACGLLVPEKDNRPQSVCGHCFTRRVYRDYLGQTQVTCRTCRHTDDIGGHCEWCGRRL